MTACDVSFEGLSDQEGEAFAPGARQLPPPSNSQGTGGTGGMTQGNTVPTTAPGNAGGAFPTMGTAPATSVPQMNGGTGGSNCQAPAHSPPAPSTPLPKVAIPVPAQPAAPAAEQPVAPPAAVPPAVTDVKTSRPPSLSRTRCMRRISALTASRPTRSWSKSSAKTKTVPELGTLPGA